MAREVNIGTPPENDGVPAFDFTNVFGDRGRSATVGGGRDGGDERATSRRRVREGSVTGGGGATSSQAPPTVEDRVFAMLRALETQGQTTSNALSAVLSRLDSVETRLNQDAGAGGAAAQNAAPTANPAASPPRAGGGQGGPTQEPCYQTPPGLQQAAVGQPAWDPYGAGF